MRRFAHRLPAMLTALAVGLVSLPLQAEVILGQHDWESGVEGWGTSDTWVTVNDSGSPNPWLDITFNTTGEAEGQPEWFTLVQVDAADLFAGTWTTDMFVEFDFWADEVTPGALQLQWSSTTNTDIWAQNLTVPATTNTWTSYGASFANWSDWLFPGGTEDQYLSDLSSIDWIGIYIYRTGAGEQSYQLDNFRLMIPEPSQVIMLSSAVLACLASVRRRRRRLEDA